MRSVAGRSPGAGAVRVRPVALMASPSMKR